MNEKNLTPIKTEVITLTAKQINSCISEIKNAEKSGVKSTWIIAENLNNLISNNVPVDDIIAEIHYNKGTISRLSRTFQMMEKSDFKIILVKIVVLSTINGQIIIYHKIAYQRHDVGKERLKNGKNEN